MKNEFENGLVGSYTVHKLRFHNDSIMLFIQSFQFEFHRLLVEALGTGPSSFDLLPLI